LAAASAIAANTVSTSFLASALVEARAGSNGFGEFSSIHDPNSPTVGRVG
jgi:hypothetical protein